MIGFHLPESHNNISLSLSVADMMEKYPELFMDNVKIASFFGSSNLMWNGGRIMVGSYFPNRFKQIIKAYNDRGIPYRFTFTNPNITEEHLGDPDCNDILDFADNGLNEVIVNSPVLEEHIRKTHPNMKLTSSTCKCIRSMEGVKEELAKDYSLVVLDYNFNGQFEELEKLTADEKKRCEILVNAACVPNCQRRMQHYDYIGKMQIKNTFLQKNFNSMSPEEQALAKIKDWECNDREVDLFDGKEHPLRIDAETLYEKYVPMGFENFKIEGRGFNQGIMLEQIVRYLAKPERRDEARYRILSAAFTVQHLNY